MGAAPLMPCLSVLDLSGVGVIFTVLNHSLLGCRVGSQAPLPTGRRAFVPPDAAIGGALPIKGHAWSRIIAAGQPCSGPAHGHRRRERACEWEGGACDPVLLLLHLESVCSERLLCNCCLRVCVCPLSRCGHAVLLPCRCHLTRPASCCPGGSAPSSARLLWLLSQWFPS